jgi:hypothetical protein
VVQDNCAVLQVLIKLLNIFKHLKEKQVLNPYTFKERNINVDAWV